MLIGALSFVMHVCWGTSRKRSRRSTFTACWTNGMSRTMPGPFAPCSRPKKNTTRRSYSRTMWTMLKISHRPIAGDDHDEDRADEGFHRAYPSVAPPPPAGAGSTISSSPSTPITLRGVPGRMATVSLRAVQLSPSA